MVSVGLLAFSRRVRWEIKERDKVCVDCGSDGPLHASHINHDKRRAEYNDLENGISQCVRCHYLFHYMRTLEEIGLTFDQNAWAITSLWGQLDPWDKKKLPKPEEYGQPRQMELGV